MFLVIRRRLCDGMVVRVRFEMRIQSVLLAEVLRPLGGRQLGGRTWLIGYSHELHFSQRGDEQMYGCGSPNGFWRCLEVTSPISHETSLFCWVFEAICRLPGRVVGRRWREERLPWNDPE